MASGENHPPRGLPRPLSGGPVKFGPYWLDARLAVGGTAEVYLARPIDPNAKPRKLIVKRLLPHFASDGEGRTMFEREAALHALVHHDNVVRVYASGMAGDEPWLAMEFVDGCDLYRMLRRLTNDGRTLSPGVAALIARQVLSALGSVHDAHDAQGRPMSIVHRDVTPSNIYLSLDGHVKLGDFGIARANRATLRSVGSDMLKGKLAYLAPEQVAGEPFDYRADLFSIAVVLAEMLMGKPLFAGSGQLAVLLAIRDCRIDALRESQALLPPGAYDILERALARDPARRFPSASLLAEALAPFDEGARAARAELGSLVRWVRSAPSAEQLQAVRESAGKIRAAVAARDSGEQAERTGEYVPIPSNVLTQRGAKLGPWPFARLVEAIATGEIGRGDEVDYVGRGFAPIESIDELARFLPARSVTTDPMTGVGTPEFVDEVSTEALATVLLRVVEADATGVLFAEGPTEARPTRSPSTPPGAETGRKDLYFVNGKLHHVASNNAGELLGEYLVRRGMVSREELDFALAVLPRYGGRMGDTAHLAGPRRVAGRLSRDPRSRARSHRSSLPVADRTRRVLRRTDGPARGVPARPRARASRGRRRRGGRLERRAPREVARPLRRRHRPRQGAERADAVGHLAAHVSAADGRPREPQARARRLLATAARTETTTANEVLRALELLLIANLVAWQ